MDLPDGTITRYQAFFESLTDESVEDFRVLATPSVRYRDPMVDSKGIDAVIAWMHQCFRDMDELQFQMTGHAVDGLVVFQHWVMRFRIRKLPKRLWELKGVSKITFDENGKVADQIDYWDSSPLFESVPVLGKAVTLMKKLYTWSHG